MVTEKVLTKKADKPVYYEMVVVLSPLLLDEPLEAAINNIGSFITGRGGVILQMDRWGKRNLAYPIKHFGSGTYIIAKFSLKPGAGKELENHLKISDQVLRHLLIKLDSAPVIKAPAPAAPVAPAPQAA